MKRNSQLLCFFGLLAVTICFFPGLSRAVDNVEPSFSLSGVSVTDFGINDDEAYDLAVQSDGKIVVVGTSNNSSDDDMAVARYLKDGTLDRDFNSDGRATFAVGNGDDAAYSVDIQADGKIVLAGYMHNGTDKDFAVIRLTEDGYLDKEFDGDGQVVISSDKGDDIAYQVLIQDDGKIVVAGFGENVDGRKAIVVRLYSDGSFDNTFAENGKCVVTGKPETAAYDMILLEDGNILLGGYSKKDDFSKMALFRVLGNGTVDTVFGTAGTALIDLLEKSSIGYGMALQKDKKIIITGYSNNGQYRDILLARVSSDGSVDSTFGNKGMVIADLGYDGVAYSVAVKTDDSIVATGFGSNDDNKDVVLLYYDADGDLQSAGVTAGESATGAEQEGE